MASEWQRPDSAPLPTVYHRYTSPSAMPDGRKPTFWIQDITPDQDEEIVDFMCDSFLKEEFMCSATGVLGDPESLDSMRSLWRALLLQRAGLVALTDWPHGPSRRPRIAGCNVTFVTRRGDHLPEVRGAALRKVLAALRHVEAQVDAFARFGVGAFLDTMGLSVAPAFRGRGLGLALLRARDGLLRALGLRLTLSVFAGAASQKQSARAGFEVLARQRYADYKDEDGREVFPDAPCECFEFKARCLP